MAAALRAVDRHVALIGFMGAGKTTVGAELARRTGRAFVDVDHEIERATGMSVPRLFAERGEALFRVREAQEALAALRRRPPAVVALGGGAVGSADVRRALEEHAVTVLLDVDADEAWARVRGGDRPLAQDEAAFRALHRKRQPRYHEAADALARDVEGVVLAAGGVHVELGCAELLGEHIPGEGPLALVSDSTVAGIHGPAAQLALGPRLASVHELPPGEEAKSLASAERVWRELRLDRGGTLVALGGGCTTDVAGYVAAAYMRGIAWAAVPTTLVGQVDAGIGGKTAVDLPGAKNLVGAFHWPVATVIDPALLATLPERERREGLAEVVKTGLLAGEPLWRLPEPEQVRRCAAFKTEVCLLDPREEGQRAILNLGHTFGHALEAASDYTVRHGAAVALGLLAALRLSGLEEEARIVREVLSPEPVRVDRERAWLALGRDKKASGGRIALVLLDGPGRPRVEPDADPRDVRRALDELIAG